MKISSVLHLLSLAEADFSVLSDVIKFITIELYWNLNIKEIQMMHGLHFRVKQTVCHSCLMCRKFVVFYKGFEFALCFINVRLKLRSI